ncbi:MAG: hypothetical protein MJ237_08170 [bacterium]|nr:hypothetical protein [bacterium]
MLNNEYNKDYSRENGQQAQSSNNGIKRENVKKEFYNIFDSLDSNGNHELEEFEIEAGRQKVSEQQHSTEKQGTSIFLNEEKLANFEKLKETGESIKFANPLQYETSDMDVVLSYIPNSKISIQEYTDFFTYIGLKKSADINNTESWEILNESETQDGITAKDDLTLILQLLKSIQQSVPEECCELLDNIVSKAEESFNTFHYGE